MSDLESKYPISDICMLDLLRKYPFLRKHHERENESEDIEYNWYNEWDGTGWEKLWKVYFMPKLFEAYDTWDDEKKQNFQILDTKSKFGSLRISTSFALPDDMESILEWMSEFICEHCGKESIDEHGLQYIYQTRGWISNLCEDCVKSLKVIEDLDSIKHFGDTFGYKRWIGNGFITKKFKYNEDHTWLVNYETTFDKEQQNEH